MIGSMVQSVRIGLLAAAAVLAADVVVLATGAADGPGDRMPRSTATTTTVAGSTVPAGTAATDPTGPPVADGTTTAPPVTQAESTPTAPPTSGGPQPRIMPAPGTYTFNVTGTANNRPVPPQASFVVEQLTATDQRHTSEGSEGDSVQVMRYTPSAVQLVSLDLAGFKQFMPNPPVLFAPAPLEVGASWSWRMVSTDGQTTIDHTSTVTATEQITVAGTAVATFVIETVLTLSGDITGTIRLTSWASPAHALAVRSHQVSNISAGVLVTVNSDTTSELASLTPA